MYTLITTIRYCSEIFLVPNSLPLTCSFYNNLWKACCRVVLLLSARAYCSRLALARLACPSERCSSCLLPREVWPAPWVNKQQKRFGKSGVGWCRLQLEACLTVDLKFTRNYNYNKKKIGPQEITGEASDFRWEDFRGRSHKLLLVSILSSVRYLGKELQLSCSSSRRDFWGELLGKATCRSCWNFELRSRPLIIEKLAIILQSKSLSESACSIASTVYTVYNSTRSHCCCSHCVYR